MIISIIIPVYNTTEYKLLRCLDSVLNQSFESWECIIVDDGSSTETRVVIDKYIKKDARFIAIHKENGGVSSARNKGIDIAKGEWIVFVDSDDYILPNHLSGFTQSVKEDIDMVVTGFKQVTKIKDTAHSYKNNQYIGKVEISDFLNNTDFLSYQTPWDKCYRNKKNLKFDELLSLSEDRLFCYQYLLECSGISTTSYITYIYDRMDEQGLSSKHYSSSMNWYRYMKFKKISKKLKSIYNLKYELVKSYQNYLYSDLRASLICEGKIIQRIYLFLIHKFYTLT